MRDSETAIEGPSADGSDLQRLGQPCLKSERSTNVVFAFAHVL